MSAEEIEQVWERFKPTIWNVWVKERRSMKQLQHEMQGQGFHATESTYQKHFKKWGFSQNIPKEVWKVVEHRIKKRKRDALESEVIIDGVWIEPKRVKKETSRSFFQTSELMKTPNPSFPEGFKVSICSPIPFSLLSLNMMWPETMPWIRFDNQYRTYISTKLPTSSGPGALMNLHQTLMSQGDNLSLQHIFAKLCAKNTRSTIDPLQIASQLATRVPECYPGQHVLDSQSFALGPIDHAAQVAFRWALNGLSNNAAFSDEAILGIFDAFEVQKLSWSDQMPLRCEPTVIVILKRFFAASIRCGRTDILKWVLDLGLSSDTRIGMFDEDCTHHDPLVVSFDFPWETENNDQIVELLLRSRTSTATSPYCCEDHGTILQYAIVAASLASLKALMNHEVQVNGHIEFPSCLQTALLSVRDTASMEAEQKLDYLYGTATQASPYPVNLLDDLMSPDGLIMVVEQGSNALLRFLHRQGANFNSQSHAGMFPLAACLKREPIWKFKMKIRLLLSIGASVQFVPKRWNGENFFSALHYAIIFTDIETCEILLEEGANPNILASSSLLSDNAPIAPLQLALSWTYQNRFVDPKVFECMRLLLSHGAILRGDEILLLASNHACRYPEIEDIMAMVALLVSKGVNPDLKTANGESALQIAIRENNHNLAIALLESGAASDCMQGLNVGWLYSWQVIQLFGKGPVNLAECVTCLLESSSFDQESATRLWGAFFNKVALDPTCMGLELETSSFHLLQLATLKMPHEMFFTALDALASATVVSTGTSQMRYLHLVQLLLKAMQPLNYPNPKLFGAFAKALLIFGRVPQLLDILVSNIKQLEGGKLKYELSEHDPLCILFTAHSLAQEARAKTRMNIMTTLFQAGIQPSTKAGLLCISNGSLCDLQMLLDNGFNPGMRYPWSSTALQLAAYRGDPDIIKLLLEHYDVNVNGRPSWRYLGLFTRSVLYYGHWYLADPKWPYPHESRTALQFAVESGNQACISILLERGADINAAPAPIAGATALQLAAAKGYVGITKWLLSLGADVNAPGATTLGRTALEGAAENGRLDVVHLLLVSGCSTTGDGRPQLIRGVLLAEKNQHHAVASLLRSQSNWSKSDDEQCWLYISAIEKDSKLEGALLSGNISEWPGYAWDEPNDGECCDDDKCICCHSNK